MLNINLKSYNFTTKQRNGNTLIFDIVRKKYIILTPEELVRQHVIHYLVDEKKIPLGLINVEKSIVFNGLNKRFDVVVYSRDGQIFLLVECKAPYVEINQKVVQQAGVYQKVLNPVCIMLTNGFQNIYFARVSGDEFTQQPDVPTFPL